MGLLLLSGVSLILWGLGEDKEARLPDKTNLTKYLPDGSVIAEITIGVCPLKEEDITRLNKKYIYIKKPAVIYADIDLDGEDEVIVGYINQRSEKKEAHITILKQDKTNNTYKEIWKDNESFGYEFGIRNAPSVGSTDWTQRSLQIFHVADLNNDNIPELIFSRASFAAEGSQTEIWRFNGKEYVQTLKTGGAVEIREDGNGNPGILNTTFNAGIWQGAIYSFDKAAGKYKSTETFGTKSPGDEKGWMELMEKYNKKYNTPKNK